MEFEIWKTYNVFYAIKISGNDIIFVYPDMKTVLIGKFNDGEMISAKRSKIIKERCRLGIKEIKVANPKNASPIMKFERPNWLRFGDNPKIADPFEQNHVFVKTTKSMGDGLFARKNITAGSVVAYYSGLLLNPKQTPIITKNMTMDQGYVYCF